MSMYLHIQNIPGNVSTQGHEEWIELESLSFNVNRKLSTTPGNTANREGSRPNVGEITLSKRVDKTSPALFSQVTTGGALAQVMIDITRTDDSLTPHTQFTLSNVMLSSYSIKSLPADVHAHPSDYPLETLALNFTHIEMKVTPSGPDNKPMSPVTSSYDLVHAKAG